MRPSILATFCLSCALLLAGGCATTRAVENRDPWESYNRKAFAFNDAVDRAILKPVAQGYQKVTPPFVQERVNNFFDNLSDVGTGLNNFLQGKPVDGINDFGRFLVNVVLGVGGLWDVATPLGVDKHDEDFGQTLAVWGVPSGPYFVIPFLGPSTARDAPARAADPSWYYSYAVESDAVYWSLWSLDKVRQRANLFKAEGVLEQAALDRYTFVRDAWLQRRRNQVFDGNPPRPKYDD